MTEELTAFFDRSMAAERVGDAAEALAYHDGISMFGRSRHRSLLQQLVGAKDELTPWVWARWIVYQSLRCEDPGSPTRLLLHAALREAMDGFHGDLMRTAYYEGGDPVQVAATVMGESWAFHQFATHEYDVLSCFLDQHAGGQLAASAELARSWVGAAMGGYRVEGAAGGCLLSVRDLATNDAIELLDLGAAHVAGPGGWVIGRLVPSGTTPGLMFDQAPLAVDERTAREVAHSTTTASWVVALRAAIDMRRLSGSDLLHEDYELMTDVPSLGLVAFGTRPADLARVMTQLREGRDEVGRAAFRILRRAAEGSLEDAAAPYVAAAVLNVPAYGEAQRAVLAPGQQGIWLHWAERVPEPARGRLLGFAAGTADAA
jgi:hypothetical protein